MKQTHKQSLFKSQSLLSQMSQEDQRREQLGPRDWI